jgi:hypothetical protein
LNDLLCLWRIYRQILVLLVFLGAAHLLFADARHPPSPPGIVWEVAAPDMWTPPPPIWPPPRKIFLPYY